MRHKALHICVLVAVLCGPAGVASAEGGPQNDPASGGPVAKGSWGTGLAPGAFIGQDLHLRGGELTTFRLSTGEHILVFNNRFSLTIGGNQYASDNAVVWLESVVNKFTTTSRLEYAAKVYLQDHVTVQKAVSAKTTELGEMVIAEAQVVVVWFSVSGEVFVTADKRQTGDPRDSELYGRAMAGLRLAKIAPTSPEAQPVLTKRVTAESAGGGPPTKPPKKPAEPEPNGPVFRYPVNLAPAGQEPPRIERTTSADGSDIVTVMGRFYIWQKKDEKGGLLELQADCAVIFFSGQKTASTTAKAEDLLAAGTVQGVYLYGDVLMTEGPRTIRASQMYYDFERKKALVKDAVMRSFDAKEGIPVYVRAEELRQLAENQFAAENVVLTSSEFYKPQVMVNVSTVVITDMTPAAQAAPIGPGTSDSSSVADRSASERPIGAAKTSYDVQMHDATFKAYDKTFFHWPYYRGNLERSDIPIKSVNTGHSSSYGFLVETRWYLARLLGVEEPEGVESTYALDFYDERGVGTGVDIDYTRDRYFGKVIGYLINDSGEDRLGRHESRKHLQPKRDLRGRFLWQHRQYLPDNWQLAAELGYVSDENFMEGFYRSEYYTGKEQETLLHLKRIEDNRGLSLLGKARINDFSSTIEEVPTGEYHWTGQSFAGDNLTFYSDTQVSRFRQRYASSTVGAGPQQFFTFATTRNEVDMPLTVGRVRVVPFVAGTVGYEDRLGYYTELDGGTGATEDKVWFGETGVRVAPQPYWKVYPDAKSRLWNLNQLRHVIAPHVTAVGYTQTDSVIEQRDTTSVGLSQRLQTKRGPAGKQRIVDWMRLDTDVTWVNDSGDSSAGPDRFIWNKPFIPLVPQPDRRSTALFGPRRNYFSVDYLWRLTDTTALLSDMNFDMQSSVVQQFNIGVSHLRWPNLSYYIGSRYLRRVEIYEPGGSALQKGSNAFVFALSYVLDPRYTVVFSQQVDFDYGATVRSEIGLLRRYHRMYWGLTYSADESLDEQGVIFSIWPQGVRDLSFGPRRYMGVGGVAGY